LAIGNEGDGGRAELEPGEDGRAALGQDKTAVGRPEGQEGEAPETKAKVTPGTAREGASCDGAGGGLEPGLDKTIGAVDEKPPLGETDQETAAAVDGQGGRETAGQEEGPKEAA
jgi:hypothetical protein